MKPWKNLSPELLKIKERKVFVSNFRRITKHDILNLHLSKIGIKNSPKCDLCRDEDQTSEHLLECTALEDMREVLKRLNLTSEETFSKLYWHVRNLNLLT
jgi:hypothetical protein